MYTKEESQAIRKQLVGQKVADVNLQEFNGLYQPVLKSMLGSDDSTRTIAVDTMSVWLLRASQLNVDLVSTDDAHQIFDYMMNFKVDSGAALGNALRELFQKLIMVMSKTHPYILKEWLVRAMNMPKSMRVHYFIVEILVKHVGGGLVLAQEPDYLDQILTHMDSFALANPASKAMFALVTTLHPDMVVEDWVELWAAPVRNLLVNHPAKRHHMQIYFLTTIFKKHPSTFQQFMKPLLDGFDRNDQDKLDMVVGCLRLAQRLNIDVHQSVDMDLLEGLLRHASLSLRISGVSLLLSAPQSSKPIDNKIYQVVLANLDNLLVDPDSGYRNEIVGLLRHFVFRVRASAYALDRDIKRGLVTDPRPLEENRAFMEEFLRYIVKSLRPGTPYHSMFSATQLFIVLVESGLDASVPKQHLEKRHIPFPYSFQLFDAKTVRLLVNNLTNNYDDIRGLTTGVVEMAPLPIDSLTTQQEMEQLLDQGRRMVSGMRGREGDGGARVMALAYRLQPQILHSILDDIEANLSVAESNLAVAVRENSVHGYFVSLMFIAHALDAKLVDRIVAACQRVWPIVKPILCHDSPEGNIPDEMGDQPELEAKYGPASQIISSYAWRAVKDSVGLLKTLFDKLPEEMLKRETVVECGELIMTQLVNVQHKGAFATVYPAFISCCKRCQPHPQLWMEETLAGIENQGQRITRRSGGIPYIITAVVIADPNPEELLSRVFDRLLEIANKPAQTSGSDKVGLPQVHAFNCIKVLFIESDLSKLVGKFADRALELSIRNFDHPIWAMRNCAVMLYTALQARLFGSKIPYCKHIRKVVFTKYKLVHQVLLDHLRRHVAQIDTNVEGVYPVLALLARLRGVDGYTGLDEFKQLVVDCLSSRIWKVREMAARTLASLVTNDEKPGFGEALLFSATIRAQNTLHGICQAILELSPEMDIKQLEEKFNELCVLNPVSATALAYLRVMMQCGSNSPLLRPYCEQLVNADLPFQLNSSLRMLKQEAARYLLENGADPVNFLSNRAYEVQQEAITFLEGRKEVDGYQSEQLWKVFEEPTNWDQVRGPAVRVFSKLCDAINSPEQAERYWQVMYANLDNSSTDIYEPCVESLGLVAGYLPTKLDQWLQVVRRFGDENQPYPTRLAALHSIINHVKTTNTTDYRVMIELWKFHSDDDCELREIAAEFAMNGPVAVPFADQTLLERIAKDPASHSTLKRLVIGENNLETQLEQAMQEDNQLFSVEKANMFRNELGQLEQVMRVIHGQTTDEPTGDILSRIYDPQVYLVTKKFQYVNH